jgi:CBS domain-containing protein
MTPDPLTVTPDTPAYIAAEILASYKFGALPVLKDGELVGIVSVTDFLNHFSADRPERPVRSFEPAVVLAGSPGED